MTAKRRTFYWTDLRNLPLIPGSRRSMAVALLLEGKKVNLAKVPIRHGFRSKAKVRRDLEELFALHKGIYRTGATYWIPLLKIYGAHS